MSTSAGFLIAIIGEILGVLVSPQRSNLDFVCVWLNGLGRGLRRSPLVWKATNFLPGFVILPVSEGLSLKRQPFGFPGRSTS